MQADSLPSEPPRKFLEPEGQGQILGLPPTTCAPMASYSLSPCLNFVTSEMGMTLIGDIDLVPTTSQVLPSELFTHHIGRFPSATYFVEEESRAQRDASWNCCENLKCTTCAMPHTAVCAGIVAPKWGRGSGQMPGRSRSTGNGQATRLTWGSRRAGARSQNQGRTCF